MTLATDTSTKDTSLTGIRQVPGREKVPGTVVPDGTPQNTRTAPKSAGLTSALNNTSGSAWTLIAVLFGAGIIGYFLFNTKAKGTAVGSFFAKNKEVMLVVGAVAILLISGLLIWQRLQRSKGFTRFAYNEADFIAFNKIVNWVKKHDAVEYAWWNKNIYLYMPGGPRDNMFGIEVADMPDGTTSLSKRALVAMSELKYPLPQGYAAGIYQATQQFYNDFLKTV